ncbi:MAG: CRTAC1 family protein [Acidobacteria bacterium]|nr:MAG: CRTAC1 family protein [Acidobacteriota bacterium]
MILAAEILMAGLLVLLAPLTRADEPPAIRFTDAGKRAGIDYVNVCGASLGQKGWLSESLGAGAAWLDYDGDGNLDLFLVNGSTYEREIGRGEPNRLFRGDGTGRFVDVTDSAAVGDRGWGLGVAVADYDNDGDPDIYVTNFGPNKLYRNNGDGTFSDVTEQARVGDDRLSTGAVFFDMEGDGDLDLYVGNYMLSDPTRVPRAGSDEARKANCQYRGIPVACGPLGQVPLADALYRNNGNGSFDRVSVAAGIALDPPRFTLGVVSGDYDNDGDTDLYVANDSVENTLWQNQGDGTFIDVGLVTLSALNVDGRPQAGMGTDFGDYNGDGWLDLVVTNFSQDYNTIYRNVGGKYFADDSGALGLYTTQLALSWGIGFHDFDRDGDLDLFIANGHIYPEIDEYAGGNRFRQKNQIFRNDGDGFVDVSAMAGAGLAIERSYRGAAFGDYDNDGDMDVYLTALQERGLLLRNDTPATGHWLEVRLIGTRSNRDGIGARVTLSASGRRQLRERKGGGSYLSSGDPRLHFGLGAATLVDLLEVRWPSGARDVLRAVPVDRQITIREGEGLVD